MEILFYEYGSICEPDILIQFQKLGLTVTEEKTEISNKNLLPSKRITMHDLKEFISQIQLPRKHTKVPHFRLRPASCFVPD